MFSSLFTIIVCEADLEIVMLFVSPLVRSNVETKMLMSDRVTEWPSDWRTEWQTDRVTEWPSDRVTYWLIDWLTDWLSDWLTKWLSD